MLIYPMIKLSSTRVVESVVFFYNLRAFLLSCFFQLPTRQGSVEYVWYEFLFSFDFEMYGMIFVGVLVGTRYDEDGA